MSASLWKVKMKIKKTVLIIALTLTLLLTSCDLPEVTPPTPEIIPTNTPAIQVPPAATETVMVPAGSPVQINAGNAASLALSHKAALSNVQSISWASNAAALSLVTQNSDSAGNQVYGVTTVNAPDLATQSVFSSQVDRVVTVAPDGRTAALVSPDMNSFTLVDLADNNKVLFTSTPGYLVGYLSFSPDMKYLAVTKMEYWEVVLIDLVTYQEVRTLTGFSTAAPVFNASFQHSPQWMLWHARATIQLQEVETGMMGPVFSHEDFVMDYDLTADGTLLASAAGKTVNNNYVSAVTIWDTSTGGEIRTLELSGPANALQFSPDGKLLAIAVGNELQVWDPVEGKMLTTLTGHSDMVTKVAFSPDQKAISTSGLDNQLYLWQVIE